MIFIKKQKVMGRAKKKLKKAPSRSKILKIARLINSNLNVIKKLEQDLLSQ